MLNVQLLNHSWIHRVRLGTAVAVSILRVAPLVLALGIDASIPMRPVEPETTNLEVVVAMLHRSLILVISETCTSFTAFAPTLECFRASAWTQLLPF